MHADQKYIDALLTNDTAILDELYVKFSGKIKSMVLKNSGTEDDAADVMQEGLLIIYRKAKSGGFILTCPFEAFLYTVCKCRWLKELAKRKKEGVTFTENQEYSISDADLRMAELMEMMDERRNLFRQKLEQLGSNCRKLLKMSWYFNSMEEVAKELNITYGYARKKKSECMAKLIMLIKESPTYKPLT